MDSGPKVVEYLNLVDIKHIEEFINGTNQTWNVEYVKFESKLG